TRFERSTWIVIRVWRIWSPPLALTQPTAPLGSAVLVTPSQPPREATTDRTVGLPNSVESLMWATTRPFGFARRAMVRPCSTAAVWNEAAGAGAVRTGVSGGTGGAAAARVSCCCWVRARLLAAKAAAMPAAPRAATRTMRSTGRDMGPTRVIDRRERAL